MTKPELEHPCSLGALSVGQANEKGCQSATGPVPSLDSVESVLFQAKAPACKRNCNRTRWHASFKVHRAGAKSCGTCVQGLQGQERQWGVSTLSLRAGPSGLISPNCSMTAELQIRSDLTCEDLRAKDATACCVLEDSPKILHG